MTNGASISNPVHKYQAQESIIGEGAYSQVYLGRNVQSGESVALKLTDYSNLPENSVHQIKNEVTMLKKVSSLPENEDLLKVHDVIEQDSELCIVTEYIEGGDLGDYCSEYPNGIPERIAKWPFKKLLKATQILHKNNICHRDLKLENIMYNKETHKLKLIDFGFATETKDVKNDENILHTDPCGSVHYAAPEIIQHKPYDGKKADVWSLGIILFILLSGLFPFDDYQNRTEIIFDKIVAGNFFMPSYLSSEVSPLLRSMLHKDPKKRPSVEEILKHPWFVAQR